MTQMGPEALLTQQRMHPLSGMGEYARLEYRPAERLWVEAAMRTEAGYALGSRSAVPRLLRWSLERLRGGKTRVPLVAAVRPRALGPARERGPTGPSIGAGGLAAVPALQGAVAVEGDAHRISAVPVLGRA